MIGTEDDPGYIALRAAGYRFENTGVRLGDRLRDPAASCYGIYAPTGALIEYRTGMVSAYALALAHYLRGLDAKKGGGLL